MKDTRPMEGKAGLHFLPSGTPEGFASKAVSSDNDANPSVIVRELIQNSLDAGTPPGSKVEVEFIFGEMAVPEIPGINTYKAAFEAAKKAHSQQAPEAAEAQIERITDSLASSKVPVLQVLDNGIGLDARRTNALLSDGLTNKVGTEANSAGSYGLGHYTAFPASDLQYILYGGVTQDGHRTMSGHAILASHFDQDDQELLGKDGYFTSGSNPQDIWNRYRFPENGDIPSVVEEVLDDIESRRGRGTAVILLAFNDFRDENNPVESVLRVASRHFYPVIRTGNLIVRTERKGDVKVLDEAMAADLLKSSQNERRSRSDAINGSKAFAIWRTLNAGQEKEVDTGFGPVKLYMRSADPDESTRINLFRSGMFITDAVPLNQASNFAEYRRFNAVVLFDTPRPDEDARGFELVRQSEGEKHASVDKKRLPKDKRAQFDKLLRSIREALKEMATKDDADTFTPEGFMELELSVEAQRINPPRTTSSVKQHPTPPKDFTPVPEQLEPFPDGERRKKNRRRAPKPERVSKNKGRRVQIAASARRDGNVVRVAVKAEEDIASATLRLLADQGADASCSNPLADQPIQQRIAGSQGKFVKELVIGQLHKGERREIDVALETSVANETVLKVDVLSRKPPAKDGDEE